MSTHDFKSRLLLVNRVSNYKIKKLNLRHYRVGTFPLTPTPGKGLYLFPKKECLKYTRKFIFESDNDSNKRYAKKGLKIIQRTRPTSLVISSTAVHKLTDKLDLVDWLNNNATLANLSLRIEGGLFENEIANILYILILRAPNLRSLSLDLKRCSIKPGAITYIMKGLFVQAKLEEFVYNISSADISDVDMQHFVETFSNPLQNLKRLKLLILCLKSNRRITDEGVTLLSNLITELKKLNTFKLDIVGTSISASGLKNLLNALVENKDLEVFSMHANEIIDMYSVLADFFERQQNLTQVGLDLSHDIQLNDESLKMIQTTIAKLPRLHKYKINVDGCERLEEKGTFYLPESLGIFTQLKDLEVHFPSFLQSEDKAHAILDTIINSLSNLTQLESLSFDFSSCADWFTETDNETQTKFFEAFPVLVNLKKLSLNLKKSQINPFNLQRMQLALANLQHLVSLEIDLSFCKSIKEKDLKTMMFYFASELNLITLKVNADDINYDENKLLLDIQQAIKSSKTLRELYISLKKTLMGRQATSIMTKIEPKHPGFDLTVKGGQAFTIVKPVPGSGNRNVFKPAIKSRFGK